MEEDQQALAVPELALGTSVLSRTLSRCEDVTGTYAERTPEWLNHAQLPRASVAALSLHRS